MQDIRIQKIAEIISAEIIGSPEGEVREIYFDSRIIFRPKSGIFFSFGSRSDHIEEAYKKGIRVFVTSEIESPREDAVYLKVDSPLKALQHWAEIHRKKFDFPVIGITGSNGKTIVKEWLNQLLWKKFSIVRSPKSYNSKIGVPLSVLQMNSENNLGIFEAGISQPGEMKTLEEIINPQIGVLCHTGTAHLENFESQGQLISEKLKLFENAEKIVFNSGSRPAAKFIHDFYGRAGKKFFTFGPHEQDTIRVHKIKDSEEGRQIEVIYRNENLSFSIPFLDKASTENILTVLTTLVSLDLDLKEFLPHTQELLPIEMRLELIEAVRNSLIINDTFNSDLQSVKVALDVLAQQPFSRKSLVLTDILQSSLDKDRLYSETAGLVNAHKLDDLVLIGKDITRYRSLFHTPPRCFGTTEEFIRTLSLKNVDNEAILLKGARPFELEKVSTFLEKKSHDTVLEINLQALVDNLNYFKSRLRPETKIMAMIKANSYGTGSFEISSTLEHQKIDYLGAAYADEGVELRKAGITLPIVVMNPEQSSYSNIIDHRLEPEIYSFRVLELFLRELKEKSVTEAWPVHIKIDTGMNRLGFRPEETDELIKRLKDEKSIKVSSVFTHLATADMPEEREFALQQLESFDKVYEKIAEELNIRPLKHALNSAGALEFPEYQYDMVRLGIGLYGISVNEEARNQLKAVASFKTVISRISEIEEGETVSYGRRFKAQKKTRIATLPVGYADGIRRSLGNGKGKVSVNGKLVPIIGTICMDMLMLDVSGLDCDEGDEVIIFGKEPSLSQLAEWMQTIPYEVLTSISHRVKRVYYRE